MEIFNLFRILLYVGPTQSYMHLKMGLPPVLNAGSSGKSYFNETNLKGDGGCHTRKQQVNSFIGLWPYVRKNGGIYVIEDIFTSFHTVVQRQ